MERSRRAVVTKAGFVPLRRAVQSDFTPATGPISTWVVATPDSLFARVHPEILELARNGQVVCSA